jgi:hypothetical protein
VIDAFLRAVPHALRDVQAAPGISLEITVSGPGGGTWGFSRCESRWTIRRGSAPAQAAARVVVSSGTLWRVATRGITVGSALSQASLEGDRSIGEAALSLVSIIR